MNAKTSDLIGIQNEVASNQNANNDRGKDVQRRRAARTAPKKAINHVDAPQSIVQLLQQSQANKSTDYESIRNLTLQLCNKIQKMISSGKIYLKELPYEAQKSSTFQNQKTGSSAIDR